MKEPRKKRIKESPPKRIKEPTKEEDKGARKKTSWMELT